MNLALGLLTGLVFGWATYGMLGSEPGVTRRTALLVGALAGTVATEFQPIFDPSGTGAALRVAGIAMAAVIGGGSIVVLSFSARKFGRG